MENNLKILVSRNSAILADILDNSYSGVKVRSEAHLYQILTTLFFEEFSDLGTTDEDAAPMINPRDQILRMVHEFWGLSVTQIASARGIDCYEHSMSDLQALFGGDRQWTRPVEVYHAWFTCDAWVLTCHLCYMDSQYRTWTHSLVASFDHNSSDIFDLDSYEC